MPVIAYSFWSMTNCSVHQVRKMTITPGIMNSTRPIAPSRPTRTLARITFPTFVNWKNDPMLGRCPSTSCRAPRTIAALIR